MIITQLATTGITQTGQQTVAVSAGPLLELDMPVTYGTYQAIRNHPTVALVRALSVAPAVAGSWSTKAEEGASDDMIDLVESEFFRLRQQIMRQSLTARIDYGWAPYETVFGLTPSGKIGIVKLKQLLQEITTIRIEKKTGAFAGFEQDEKLLPLEYCFLVSWDVEGTYWYGAPLLENIRAAYDNWVESNAGAVRYDEKVAGAHWVVHYPPGEGTVDGTVVSNYDKALEVLRALESTGNLAIPNAVQQRLDDMNAEAKPGWVIELIADGSPKQYSFNNRLSYLDTLMVRGILMPERAILEGTHGTKAEATEHKTAALTNLELAAKLVTSEVNAQLVNPLLVRNFGESAKGLVRLEDAPILDEKLTFLRELLQTLVKDPSGFFDLFAMVDTTSLFDRLGIPRLAEDEVEAAVAAKQDVAKAMKELSDNGGAVE